VTGRDESRDGPVRADWVEAAVASARSTGESVPAAVVTLRFRNRSASALEVRTYRLSWPGGDLTTNPDTLRLSPGLEVERTLRVESRHGDVAALLQRMVEARVEVVRVERF
jgi:hypothetical protein